MSSFGSAPGGPRKARIEIIPLIDVIFFLLATFVLFTLSLNKTHGLPVSLPAASTSENRDPARSVTVTVTAEGTLAWDRQPVTLDQFLINLQAYVRTEPEPRVLINGDENARFTQVRYVIDEIRKAGISKALVETRIRSAD